MEMNSAVDNVLGMSSDRSRLTIVMPDGRREQFDESYIIDLINAASAGLVGIDGPLIAREVMRTIFDGITSADVEKALVLASTTLIERDPVYSTLSSRLLRNKLIFEVTGLLAHKAIDLNDQYSGAFVEGIRYGIANKIFTPALGRFALDELAACLKPERDDLIDYMGMHTLYERYFLKHKQKRVETPQAFWMRIAMGLAINEPDKMARAKEFYEVMSTLRYVPSTPTLFHAAYDRAQLSSCYLNTVGDDLADIFKCVGDNAQLAKWAGGLGTDWTNIRGAGAYIKSIKATGQGVVPYLKIANDVVVAITRSGIRRGGSCAYLELWHYDVEDFLDLKRNTGDERRRTHDMNTAVWVPDLFMKRVIEDGNWTLFSSHEVPELHHLYGKAFEEKYCQYEALVGTETITLTKQIPAKQLWRKMLTRLFETGHPWITFKDPCNIRSPQDHAGVVHCSNLCTEITLNTSSQETAVCNLGSVNLKAHVKSDGTFNDDLLNNTVKTAMRMLDNVIDINFYPTKEARHSNLKHRPLGLGLMGFQDMLFAMDVAFSDPRALELADTIMEKISYNAITASSDLAAERGAYESYKGSKWDRGIFPLDTLDMLEAERGVPIDVSRTSRLDWDTLKAKVKKTGMRNSNLMAIAPTATISTITGCYPSIEPIYKNIYVKSNVSGEFTIINACLVNDLKKRNLWDKDMLDIIKYYDGDLQQIDQVPSEIKEKYKTAFELDAEWLIRISAARGKWIDQAQSYNIFLKGATGAKMNNVYMAAWRCGLKTTYYARTLGATQVEKATLDTKYGFTQKREYQKIDEAQEVKACSIENPECESCQ